MKHLYLSFLCCTFFLFTPDIFANSPLRTNEAIGGIINSYGAISNISTGTNCSSTLTVDDATGFMPGDYAWVIQMQGATIDESNSASFGNITALNGAGLFEKVEIASVNGNQITTSASLLNTYQIAGKVQIVSFPQYMDAEVTSDVVAMPWNGEKGGVLAFEVLGTLTLQANVDASMSGFRGGTTSNSFSDCFITSQTGYHYQLGDWESEGKGEGIAAYITGKEYGKGAQANGGGGGNDHNAGGGGGAGFAAGGTGGENEEPTILGCHGNDPGIGGKVPTFTDSRLFLGGGGGAGSENNNQATHGGVGGGIILISANIIAPNSFSILANGENNVLTIGLDGGGGGGGGGTVSLQATTVSGTLNVETKGGQGSDTKNLNQPRCMGPGGGGGGGVIYTNINSNMLTTSLEGGQAGVVTLSTEGCDGSHNNGQAGGDGSILPMHSITFNPGANASSEMYTGCQGDGYSIIVNGVTYNESNSTGVEVLTNQFGCDSTVTIDLSFIAGGISTLSQSLCWDENLVVNGTTYGISMPSGQEVYANASANGCDSIVNVDLAFSPEMTISESTNGNDVTINIAGGTAPFDISWDNGFTGATNTLTESGSYTISVMDAFGCSSQYTFYFALTSNEDIKNEYGLEIFPNPVQNILTIQRTEIRADWNVKLMNISGQEVLVRVWQNGEQLNMNVSDLPKGIYILNIYSDEMNFAEKVIIEE